MCYANAFVPAYIFQNKNLHVISLFFEGTMHFFNIIIRSLTKFHTIIYYVCIYKL